MKTLQYILLFIFAFQFSWAQKSYKNYSSEYEIIPNYLKSKEDWNKSKDGDMILVGLQYAPCKGVKVSPNFRLWLPSDSEKKTEPSVFLNLEIKI